MNNFDLTKSFEELSREFGTIVRQSVPLASYTTYKIGGPADILIEARSAEEMVSVIRKVREMSLPLTILGGGTNILVGDKGVRGVVIKNLAKRIIMRAVTGKKKSGIETRVAYVEADSGVLLNSLVRYTVEEGLSGLEMHLGLPGTVGGAIYMNSKWTAPEGYVGDCVYSATVLTPQNEITVVDASHFNFAYDYSELQKNGEILLSVIFELTIGDKVKLWEIANNSISHRRSTQPQGVRSAGCTFKNLTQKQAHEHKTPEFTVSAGYLIDSVGLKGTVSGDAMISDAHANFIVNKGRATASDVLQLIYRAKEQVKLRYGIELEEEIVLVGEF